MRLPRLARRLAAPALALLVGSSCTERGAPLSPGSPRETSSAPPKLLHCPVDQALEYAITVDPLGTAFEVPDGTGGTHSLVFPPEAVSVPTLFHVAVPASKHLTVEVAAIDPPSGLAVPISFPEHAQPTLSLSYVRCGNAALRSADLRLFNVDPATGAVLEGPFGGNDPAGNRVTGAVPHFSQYSIGTP